MAKTLGIALLLVMTGCASQSDLEKLRNEVEQLKKGRVEQKQKLESALQEAETSLSYCKLAAENTFNEEWKGNSTPGKNGMRWGNREMLNQLREEQHRNDADCQREYENALQKAKLLYGSQGS